MKVLPKVGSFWQMPGLSECKWIQLTYVEVSSARKPRWFIISCPFFCMFGEIGIVWHSCYEYYCGILGRNRSLTGELMHIREYEPVSLLFEDNCA